jgi:hypothetical protein
MKRKDYQKPAMQVVKIAHSAGLLAGSGESDADMHDYKRKDEEDW